MLMHPEISLAVAKTRTDDLIREIRPASGGRRFTEDLGHGTARAPRRVRLGRGLRLAWRRSARAAEPAS